MRLIAILLISALVASCDTDRISPANKIESISSNSYGISTLSLVLLLSETAEKCVYKPAPEFFSTGKETVELMNAGYLRRVDRVQLTCHERTEEGWSVYRQFHSVEP